MKSHCLLVALLVMMFDTILVGTVIILLIELLPCIMCHVYPILLMMAAAKAVRRVSKS